ncbi:SDR family oxidoreductase [Algoriphagus jejuensis]|uniref:SDR family oxidoreductase n=1 Tax=Algoriphagus jejuensis TaxID=419934 RepID=A0ABP3Y8B6_9BACT
MKILLTGATGYIGRRLLPVLVEEGHQVICLLRDKRRFDWEDFSEEFLKNVSVVEADLNDLGSLKKVTKDVDVAYYLVHSMSSSDPNFTDLEAKSAENFVHYLNGTTCKHLIYLSGIVNDADLSDHLLSRKNVEDILGKANAPLTVLRAAIIIGSGSASFEIIRDLVEKLPMMIAPKWLNTRCQPIGIRNVVEYLNGIKMKPKAFDQTFDIGGTEILTYKQMLMGFAKVRGLKRVVITVPVLTPKLSSLWLLLVTSTTFSLARSLVSSMKNEVVCRDNRILEIVPIKLNDYSEALQLAFDKISQKNVVSTWKDSISIYGISNYFKENMQVPSHGVFTDQRSEPFTRDREEVIDNIWSIGGNRGWYFGNWMWNIRGSIDILVGGVGIRRGRRSDTELWAGEALDFWRVLVADRANGRLLLYAEMKLPGEAWLEFKIKKEGGKTVLLQTATFRPLGLWGRVYWYSVLPFHWLIFPKMIKNLVRS